MAKSRYSLGAVFTGLLLLLSFSLLSASPDWLIATDAVFDNHRDQARIELKGQAPIYLDHEVYYSSLDNNFTLADPHKNLTFDDLQAWEKGRPVKIAYATATGSVLLDPESGKYTEIVSGMTEHPLDLLYQKWQEEGSTASVVVAANKILAVWDLEIARIYDRLRKEFPGTTEVFDQAQQAWETFLVADSAAQQVAFDKEGTIYFLAASDLRVVVRKNHATRLARFGRY